MGLGMYYSALAYSIYVLPILSYVVQLCNVPEEAYEIESKALRAIIPGPYQWILPADLFVGGQEFGQGRSFPSLMNLAQAAKKRVEVLEGFQKGGLWSRRNCQQVRSGMESLDGHIDRYATWSYWFDNDPSQALEANKTKLEDQDILTQEVWEKAMGPLKEGDSYEDRLKKVKKNFQKTVLKEIKGKQSHGPATRMRHKLDRWNLPGIPRVTAA